MLRFESVLKKVKSQAQSTRKKRGEDVMRKGNDSKEILIASR